MLCYMLLCDLVKLLQRVGECSELESEGPVSLCSATTQLDVLSRCGRGVRVLREFCSLD